MQEPSPRTVRALLAFTFVTGLIDAASLLGLAHVFVANMTGNIVFIGFSLLGQGESSLEASMLALGGFLLGALSAGRALAVAPQRGLRTALGGDVALLAVAAALSLLRPGVDVQLDVVLLAISMGGRTAVVRHLGVPDLTTTVLSLTVTGIAADSSLAGGTNPRLARRLASVAFLVAGAATGALLFSHVLSWLIPVAAVLEAAARLGPRARIEVGSPNSERGSGIGHATTRSRSSAGYGVPATRASSRLNPADSWSIAASFPKASTNPSRRQDGAAKGCVNSATRTHALAQTAPQPGLSTSGVALRPPAAHDGGVNPAPDPVHDLRELSQLEALFEPVKDVSILKEIDHVDVNYAAWIAASPFCVLATAGPGGLDCSPRGDEPGFVRLLDPKTLVLPDRRGNNRVDSLRNLMADPRAALLFLIPGQGETLRVNGRCRLNIDPVALAQFAVSGKLPKLLVVMSVESVYFQCSRAVVRSKLWDPLGHVAPGSLPTPGKILADLSSQRIDGAAYDRDLPERVKTTLY